MKKLKAIPLAIALLSVGSASVTHAQNNQSDAYVSFSYGQSTTKDSSINGDFPSGFTTGAGTSVPAGTALPSGTQVGWDTEFDGGSSLNLAYGKDIGGFIGEIELSMTDSDVEKHSGVTVADSLAIDSEDAAILITGSDNLGASVADIVGDGRGNIEATYLMANVYKNFDLKSKVTPYLGVGVGIADVSVQYNPSDVEIVNDSDKVFAYQFIAGANVDLTNEIALYGQYRYRATEDVSVNAKLFTAALEVENASDSLEIGLRYKF